MLFKPNLATTGDVVITGPPNSGKTTVIKALREKGHLIVDEVATELLTEGILPWEQPERFDAERWTRQLRYEAALPPRTRPAFLDRGLFDTIAYRRAYNQSIPDYVSAVSGPRYLVSFVLAPCPWVEDGVRYEGKGDELKAREFQQLITGLLINAYVEVGVIVVQVPLMPVAERVAFIESIVGGLL